MYCPIELFEEPRKTILPKLDLPAFEPEMTEFESAFLCGMLREFKPHKILEVGIAGGGTTAIIMQCMEILGEDYELHSVDIADKFYRDNSKSCGYLGEEAKKYISGANQKFYLGKILPECIDSIGDDIDCVILDTAHVLPGEVLDFLTVFPYLKENAIIILHDLINNHCTNNKTIFRKNANATKILFDSISGKKYMMKDDSEPVRNGFPNIGAIQITNETKQNLANIVSALSNTWYYIPDNTQLNMYVSKIIENLDEESQWLLEATLKVNQNISKAPYKFLYKLGFCIRMMLNKN